MKFIIWVLFILSIISCSENPERKIYSPQQPEYSIYIETFRTDKGLFTVNDTVFLDGRELDAKPIRTLMELNLWDATDHIKKVVCTLKHGDKVKLLEISPKSTFVKLQHDKCIGWIESIYICPEQNEPVGDRLYLKK